MRWIWRRWAWAVLSGILVAATAAADTPGKVGPGSRSAPGPGVTEGSRPNDTISLKFPGEPERKVKVVKTTRKPDGSVETEVKDVATGETLTLVDPPGGGPGPVNVTPPAPEKPTPKPIDKPAAKPTDKPAAAAKDPPKARPRATEPTATAAAAATDDGGRRGLLGGNKSGASINPSAMDAKAPDVPAANAGKAPPPAEKKPGFFSRVFGGKKSTPPAANNPAPAMPAPTAGNSAMRPPPVRTPDFGTPPTGPGRTSSPPPVIGGTGEPPRTMPSRPVRAEPVAPPSPLVPPPSPLPAIPSVPSTPVPSFPTPLPANPSIPAPLPGPGAAPRPVPMPPTSTPGLPPLALPFPMPTGVPVPTIPNPPAGGPPQAQVMVPADGGPIQVVLPAGYVPPHIAVARDIQPHVLALSQSLMPTERMLAARALADGRHGSTDHVKALLFNALHTDPCPAVQACCIEQLCKLGYYNPEFLTHLRASWDSSDEDVRRAARVALVKMTPRQ